MCRRIIKLVLCVFAIFAVSCSSDDGSIDTSTNPPTNPPTNPNPPVSPTEKEYVYKFEMRMIDENYWFSGGIIKRLDYEIEDDFENQLEDLAPRQIKIKGNKCFVLSKNGEEKEYVLTWKGKVATIKNDTETIENCLFQSKDSSYIVMYLSTYKSKGIKVDSNLATETRGYSYGRYSFSDFYKSTYDVTSKEGRFVSVHLTYDLSKE